MPNIKEYMSEVRKCMRDENLTQAKCIESVAERHKLDKGDKAQLRKMLDD